ncbi:MAG: EAL and HDOD domain-containing protein [Vicinamibacterales bacterium]
MEPAVDSRDTVCIVRQPILDSSGRVFGYELLYRDETGQDNDEVLAPETAEDEDLARARVITDAVLGLGLENLTDGLPAFVSLTRELLVRGAGSLLPADATILELPEGLVADPEVVAACRRLHDEGYKLALKGVGAAADVAALRPFVRFLRVDVAAMTPEERTALPGQFKDAGIRIIAVNVETFALARELQDAGYAFFQGYYFCKPDKVGTEALPGRRLAYLNLLTALNKPNVSISEIEDLVKHDLTLSYRVLRSINSASFGLRREVTSIRQALVLLGIGQIQKWASVWSMAGLNSGGTSETVSMAIIRARCCELLGNRLLGDEAGAEYFLLGLCSLLDSMLRRPMADALADVPVAPAIRTALLGEPNVPRLVLDAVVAYERGEWDLAEDAANQALFDPAMLPKAYADALRWARELSRAGQG